MTTSRAALRKTFTATRERLTGREREDAERAIAAHLIAHPVISAASTVAAFIATRGEVNLAPWFAAVPAALRIGLPIVAAERGSMSFHACDPRAPERLVTNRYGILEPPADAPLLGIAAFDAMLTPLVAFDRQGNRLGMGGGYYDRYLAAADNRPYLLGVAFACQQAEALQSEDWDMRLDAVVTENGVLEFA